MNASAQLEVTSNTKGFLPPRMTQAQRNDIITPAQGLIVYCSNCGTVGEAQVFNGAAWTNICGSPALGIKPTITTTTVSDIAASNAKSGGTIVSNGGDNITVSGVVWSTSASPTIALITKTTDGIGTGAFTSTIIGLIPETTYYVRAYATNSIGTSYGAEESFTTPVAPIPNDVLIGGQTWTTKNLDVSTYRDGTVIPQITDPTEWSNLTTGAWCYYDNDPANGAVYGKLYNWYAINDPRGLAPEGWHISSEAEWTTLIDYLGGLSTVGIAMKETGTTHWGDGNQNATDSSGFKGLPGGYRYATGVFSSILQQGLWWSTSERYSDYGVWFNLNMWNEEGFIWYDPKTDGMSVRCIKD
jgi:uncharacterized protein (TIGR02145 family)